MASSRYCDNVLSTKIQTSLEWLGLKISLKYPNTKMFLKCMLNSLRKDTILTTLHSLDTTN